MHPALVCLFLFGFLGEVGKMFIQGWGAKDYLVFFGLTVAAVIAAKWIGGAIPMAGKITAKM